MWKALSPKISARLPSSVLSILCSQEWEAAKHPRNARPLPGSLYLPPEGLRGAGSSLTVRGALHRRPIRPPQSGLRVGVIITIARRRARRTEAAGPRHAGGRFARHLVSPDRVGTVAARDRAWLCPTEAQGAGDGGGYCVW